MTHIRSTRRAFCLAAAGWGWTQAARADEIAVPLQLQADLSAKVVAYAQEPLVRAMDVVRIGVLVKRSSAESARAGAEIKVAFARIESISGQPHEQSLLHWEGGSALVEEIRGQKLSVLYVTPGLEAEMPVIARALQGLRIISIAAVDSYVQGGAILGFELVSGHPKMVFNLRQAKHQGVVFRSAVMKLMRIVE